MEEVLRRELDRLLGNYVPNKVDMDNLSSYLYKIVVSIFKDADMKEEFKNIKSITPLDEEGFKKAVRDISLFTSQRIMLEALNRSYKEIKNIIPMNTVSSIDVKPEVREDTNDRLYAPNIASGEAEFSIDISAIPKVKKQRKPRESVPVNKVTKTVASEFETTAVIDFDKVNKNIPTMSQNNIKPDDSDGDGGDLTLGAGLLGSASFSSVPNIDISLDY